MKNINLDHSNTSFPQDNDISFIQEGHKYIYKGVTEFTPVSHFYMSFFKSFDAQSVAGRKSQKTGIPIKHYLEEWESTGKKASEIGTFMHKQIENSLNGLTTENKFHYCFHGQYVDINEEIDISLELQYYAKFINTLLSTPFRTEWCVYDISHKIAGTIDFICKNPDGTYDMFDWKHSNKIDPNAKIWSYGINGLEKIPDTSYWHYVIQQNTYKYILEHNYGIKIRNMNLIVLHPSYTSYIKFRVPEIQNIISIMLQRFSTL